MELIKNIFFNTDKLVENSTVKMSYTGVFFEENADKVFLHYGFGNNWDNLCEIEMTKTELGYQAEINLISDDNLNCCFRDSNNNWDNNNGQNFSFVVEKPEEVSLIVTDQMEMDSPRKLRKSYIWNKKIRLAIYKIITYLPKLISGNYKRKISNEN